MEFSQSNLHFLAVKMPMNYLHTELQFKINGQYIFIQQAIESVRESHSIHKCNW